MLVGGCQVPRTTLDGRDSMVNEISESFQGIYILGMEPDQKIGIFSGYTTECGETQVLWELKRGSLNLIWRRWRIKRDQDKESELAGWWWGWNPCRGSGRRGCIIWAIEGGGQLWRSRGGKACGTKASGARPIQEPPLCADEEIGPFFHGMWAKNIFLSSFLFFFLFGHTLQHMGS